MITRYAPIILLLLCMQIFMPSCRAPKDLVYKNFQNLSSEKLGFSSSTLKVDLVYYNPNNFGLQLKRTDLDIYIDGQYLGHTQQDYQITVPKLSEFSLPLKIDVDMKNIYKNAASALLSKEVLVKVTGKITIGKLNVYKSFAVNYEEKQKFSF